MEKDSDEFLADIAAWLALFSDHGARFSTVLHLLVRTPGPAAVAPRWAGHLGWAELVRDNATGDRSRDQMIPVDATELVAG